MDYFVTHPYQYRRSIIDLEELGFSIVLDFISSSEETELISHFKKPTKKTTKNRNNIQRYGSSNPYKSNIVSVKIPSYFDFLSERLLSYKLLNEKPDSITVNEYLTGQAINPHIDSRTSGSIVTILSLLSNADMTFKLHKDKRTILLPARSLVQLKGDIRELWQHSIEPVKSLRYSIVFRCSFMR